MRAHFNLFWVRTCCWAFENCHCKSHPKFGMWHADMKKNRRYSAGGIWIPQISSDVMTLQRSCSTRLKIVKLGPLTVTPHLRLVWRFPGLSLEQSSAWMDHHTIKRLVKMRAVLSLDESFPICRARISNRMDFKVCQCLPKKHKVSKCSVYCRPAPLVDVFFT